MTFRPSSERGRSRTDYHARQILIPHRPSVSRPQNARLSSEIAAKKAAKTPRKVRLRHTRPILHVRVHVYIISKRYWGETILSPQNPGEYWGESPCCPAESAPMRPNTTPYVCYLVPKI